MYLLRTLLGIPHGLLIPSAKIPLVLLPAAAPDLDAALAEPTPQAVEEHVAYVYLLRIADTDGVAPIAIMPRVLLPAADCAFDATLAVATPDDVDAHVA